MTPIKEKLKIQLCLIVPWLNRNTWGRYNLSDIINFLQKSLVWEQWSLTKKISET